MILARWRVLLSISTSDCLRPSVRTRDGHNVLVSQLPEFEVMLSSPGLCSHDCMCPDINIAETMSRLLGRYSTSTAVTNRLPCPTQPIPSCTYYLSHSILYHPSHPIPSPCNHQAKQTNLTTIHPTPPNPITINITTTPTPSIPPSHHPSPSPHTHPHHKTQLRHQTQNSTLKIPHNNNRIPLPHPPPNPTRSPIPHPLLRIELLFGLRRQLLHVVPHTLGQHAAPAVVRLALLFEARVWVGRVGG